MKISSLLFWRKKEPEIFDAYGEHLKKNAHEKAIKEQKFAEEKLAWEIENEKKKKLDACYLNTRRTAFNGTYEEYLAHYNHNSLSSLQSLAISRGQMLGALSAQGGNYGNLGLLGQNILY